jgi:NAD(P)-dependent dehydrogenase (short-subunit alcohol dehydrogenase family)
MSAPTTDRVAIVTGTSAGIGQAVARELLSRDWSVIGIARRPATVTHPAYRHVSFDLERIATDADDLQRQIEPYVRTARLALVNNAAVPEGLMPLAALDAPLLVRTYAVNVVAPLWLMGFVMRTAPAGAVIRIVNVSSGAATTGFPGLAAYGSSKAALRLAGMSLANEWESRSSDASGARRDAAILSYEPGVVETDMQRYARSRSPEQFPWVTMFKDFATRGVLVPPERPATDIVTFLESDAQPSFAERRLRP